MIINQFLKAVVINTVFLTGILIFPTSVSANVNSDITETNQGTRSLKKEHLLSLATGFKNAIEYTIYKRIKLTDLMLLNKLSVEDKKTYHNIVNKLRLKHLELKARINYIGKAKPSELDLIEVQLEFWNYRKHILEQRYNDFVKKIEGKV